MDNVEGSFKIGNFADRIVNGVRLDVVTDLIHQIAETIPIPLNDALDVVIAIIEIGVKEETYRSIPNIEKFKENYFDWYKEKIINGS